MSTLLQAAKDVLDAWENGRELTVTQHMPALRDAIAQAETTPQRWTEEEIERVADEKYPVPFPGSMLSGEQMLNIVRAAERRAYVQALRDHALLSGEGEEKKGPKVGWKQPIKREWVRCPICNEPDMRKEWFSDDDGPYISCVNIGCRSNGAAPPQVPAAVEGVSREPATYQYRWTNPNGDRVSPSEVAWKPIEDSNIAAGQSIENKVQELLSYRSYGDVPQYEVRALFAAPSTREKELEEALLRRIIDKWGPEAQVHKIQEEALELALVLNQRKCATKDPEAMDAAIHDELADMTIMMAQARLLFDPKRIDERVAFKLKRVQEKHLNTPSDDN